MRLNSEQVVHPNRRLGLVPHDKPDEELLTLKLKTGLTYSSAVDRFTHITIGLDGNDRLGDCGPTSCDNWRRIQSLFLTGTELQAPIDSVLDLYARSTHPPFNPSTGANDNGVQMPDLMDAFYKGGLDGDKIVAYARLSSLSDESIYAAIDIFGAVIFAVNLQVAQQSQTDNRLWDYSKSGVWGGHAIVAASYDSSTGHIGVGTWGMKVDCTREFRQHQLGEVWVPIYKPILTSNKFVANVDTAALAADFTSLTGGKLPAVDPTPPGPKPAPTPGTGTFLTVGPFTDQEMLVMDRRAVLAHMSRTDYCTHMIKGRIDK